MGPTVILIKGTLDQNWLPKLVAKKLVAKNKLKGPGPPETIILLGGPFKLGGHLNIIVGAFLNWLKKLN